MPGELVRTAEVQVVRVEPERWVAAHPGTAVRRARGADRAMALYEDTMARTLPVGLGARRRAGAAWTSTSSTAPRAGTSRSRASAAWPPRPAPPSPSSAWCWSTPTCGAAPGRWCSTSRARTCCTSTGPTGPTRSARPAARTSTAAGPPSGWRRPGRSPRWRSGRRPGRDGAPDCEYAPRRPHLRLEPLALRGGRPAALLLRRRRRRPRPARLRGGARAGRAAAPRGAGARAARARWGWPPGPSRATPSARAEVAPGRALGRPVRRPGRARRLARGPPGRGRDARPALERRRGRRHPPAPSPAACARAAGRLGGLIRAGAEPIPRGAAAAGEPPVAVVHLTRLHDFAQRFVVGTLLAQTFAEKERGTAGPDRVRRARRAQQVRAPRGPIADPGHPRRHRPAGPLAGRDPDRLPAAGLAGGAGGDPERGHPHLGAPRRRRGRAQPSTAGSRPRPARGRAC